MSMKEADINKCAEVLLHHNAMIQRAIHDGSFGLGGGPFDVQENTSIHALASLGSVIDSGWVIRLKFKSVLDEELAADGSDVPSFKIYQRVMARHEEWLEDGESLAPWHIEADRIRSAR
ncbi:hypothetical protein [Acidisoma sp. C75]